jgi:hypothetical protein
MKKGNLVQLNKAVCFTTRNGGKRDYPLTNYGCDERGIVEGTRIATDEDLRAWRDSEASKGMTDGGDTKLPPTAVAVRLHRDRVYTLLRARCRPEWSYRSHPGMALVLCTVTGKEAYVKRELLEVIS